MARNGTRVADSAHQTSTCAPSTFEHVTHHGTTPCSPAYKKLLSRGESMIHVCACCKSLLKGYKELENPGRETGPVRGRSITCHVWLAVWAQGLVMESDQT